jgi:succinate-semialdehyde dehydrogenase/glutarate-semialdehyde dehydrogenase
MGSAAGASAQLGSRITSINPATGEPLGEVPDMAAAEVRVAVEAARAAQRAWGELSIDARCRRVLRFAEVLMARAEEVIDLLVREGGKTRLEALGMEVVLVADLVRYFAKHAPQMLAPEPIPLHLMKHRASYLHFTPRGVIGVIAPWNFPFSIPIGETMMSLLAGNGVVLKPSEHTPRSAEWIPQLFEEAGAPHGLVQLAPSDREAGAAIVDEPGISKLFFTGSVAVGRKVAAAAGARGCPVVLELGGRDPMIVFADADLERAVEGAAFASFLNAGQACVSAERLYVERSVHDEFRRKLEAFAEQIELAPLVLSGEQQRPQVVDGPLPDEELFAPVVAIEPFDGEDDAVRKANDTSFGLAASVWTRDAKKADRVARRIEAGMVWVNDFGYSFATGQASWGGVKASGFGRTSGKHGLYECVTVKYIDADSGRFKPGWWFPYDAKTERALRNTMEVLYGDGFARVRAAWRYRRDLLQLARRAR